MTARTTAEIAEAIREAAARFARCPFLREGERLVVIYADRHGSCEIDVSWPWLVEDCDEDVAACFAVRLSPFETRDLLGTLRLNRDAVQAAEGDAHAAHESAALRRAQI